jgi:hypothetical protein
VQLKRLVRSIAEASNHQSIACFRYGSVDPREIIRDAAAGSFRIL